MDDGTGLLLNLFNVAADVTIIRFCESGGVKSIDTFVSIVHFCQRSHFMVSSMRVKNKMISLLNLLISTKKRMKGLISFTQSRLLLAITNDNMWHTFFVVVWGMSV